MLREAEAAGLGFERVEAAAQFSTRLERPAVRFDDPERGGQRLVGHALPLDDAATGSPPISVIGETSQPLEPRRQPTLPIVEATVVERAQESLRIEELHLRVGERRRSRQDGG